MPEGSAVPADQWKVLRAELDGGVVRRSGELVAAGVFPSTIAGALRRGDIVRPLVGMYHLPGMPSAQRWKADIAAACARLPRAVVCMETAARLAGLGVGVGAPMWLGVPNGFHKNVLDPLPHRLLSWSWKGALEVGVVTSEVCGVPVRMTGPARTVVDLFRYARHVGGDEPGLTALRGLMRSGGSGEDVLTMARATLAPEGAVTRLRNAIAVMAARQGTRRPALRR